MCREQLIYKNRNMLVFRSFLHFNKYLQNSTKVINYYVGGTRGLRRLPRQNIEFQALSSDTTQQSGKESNRYTSPSILQNISQKKGAQLPRNATNDEADENNALSTGLQGGNEASVGTYNLAAYVNDSPTLQQLIKLGVDLHSIERRKGLPEFVLRLDFDADIKPYLLFLHDQGVAAEAYGELITKNPLLFKEDIDDLQTRVNYLQAKKFTKIQVQRILTKNPYWLMYSTQRIDSRLGYFQKAFHLSGDDVRFLSAKQPRLITYNMEHIRKSTFCIREEMGFDEDEIKCLLLSKPRLWMMQSDVLIERFAYAHNEMQLTHDMLIQFPEVLISREFRLRQRHEFLKMLGRAQYNPEKDLYISPKAIVAGTDKYFALNVAKSDMETYELFLKTR